MVDHLDVLFSQRAAGLLRQGVPTAVVGSEEPSLRQEASPNPLPAPIDATVCLLCGGFGGARFAPGLVRAKGGRQTSIVTNPGDDLTYLGLEVWPDFDSVLYALAGLFDEDVGWGRRDDTTACADVLGPEAWFRMGDRDLALSLLRTRWLTESEDRAEVARRCCERLGVTTVVVPASAQPHRTQVLTDAGWLELQEFLVARRAADTPLAVRTTPHAQSATAEALSALGADLVILGPSNPVTSLTPILTTPGIATRIRRAPRVVAISPTVAALAPRTAPETGRYRVRERMMAMLGLPHTADAVIRMWPNLIDGLVVDYRDEDAAARVEAGGTVRVMRTDLLRDDPGERIQLAHEVIRFGLGLPVRRDRNLAESNPRRDRAEIGQHPLGRS